MCAQRNRSELPSFLSDNYTHSFVSYYVSPEMCVHKSSLHRLNSSLCEQHRLQRQLHIYQYIHNSHLHQAFQLHNYRKRKWHVLIHTLLLKIIISKYYYYCIIRNFFLVFDPSFFHRYPEPSGAILIYPSTRESRTIRSHFCYQMVNFIIRLNKIK